MSKFINFSLLLLLVIYLFFSTSLLLDEPFVWPDEAIYGDISRNILAEGRVGTDLWKGLIIGVENHYYPLPPVFLYASSGWFNFFGFSIMSQRLFSVFLGLIFLIIIFKLAQQFTSSDYRIIKRNLPLLAVLFVAIDSVFLKASRLGRPEILVLVLTSLAMFLYLHGLKEKTDKQKNKFLFVAGLALGFAIVTHLIAICFSIAFILAYIYSQRKQIFDLNKYYFLLLGIMLPPFVWIISVYPNYQDFIYQLNLVSQSRNYTIPWYINVINFPFLMKLNYLYYLLISLSFVLYTIKNRLQSNILLSLILISTWTFATIGEIYWYTVYAIPFVYLALVVLINQAINSKSKLQLVSLSRLLLLIVSLSLIYSNTTNYLTLFDRYKNTGSYEMFSNQIIEAIPEGKTVYLSSIPDAYYAFNKGRNNLLEFPALYAGKDNFKKTLREVDYIVLNGAYIPDPQAFVYLDHYITKNFESVKELTSPYSVVIIKMKDKKLRVDAD